MIKFIFPFRVSLDVLVLLELLEKRAKRLVRDINLSLYNNYSETRNLIGQ